MNRTVTIIDSVAIKQVHERLTRTTHNDGSHTPLNYTTYEICSIIPFTINKPPTDSARRRLRPMMVGCVLRNFFGFLYKLFFSQIYRDNFLVKNENEYIEIVTGLVETKKCFQITSGPRLIWLFLNTNTSQVYNTKPIYKYI